ncbi:hypothetical protein IttPL_0136 [Pseudomonas phage ITTPL]|uniref:Uncharacterized protein n=1 Tax=Pseudomonas phage ITTPL TaxID=2544984 RepID=A0A5B7LVX9_9CAUD|nr:hypothetical protein QE324_gp135 [Pseudomonas phage ITTPL]QBP28150.1 hypothetical protein IttPL_0136 [Pseudomonas phage ITTPL]
MNKFSEVYYTWSAASSRAGLLIDAGWTATIRRDFTFAVWVVEFTR